MKKKEKKVSKIARYQAVLKVLMKYGFEEIVASPPFSNLIPRWKAILPTRDGKTVMEASRYERIRLAMEELGPTYIKFGQVLSNRDDVLPPDFLAELARLQDNIDPLEQEVIVEIIKEEYGKTPDEIFKYFEYEPLASASIAQVHRAELYTGQVVVLKIQRPDIKNKILADIRILHDIAGIISKRYPEAANMQPAELIKSFETSIMQELDFTKEANNIRRFSKNFKDNEEIYVPEVFRKYCTDRILCIEYVKGIKASDTDELLANNMDLKEISYKGTDLYFKQMFDHGFFHADPHPGNLFILRNGKICFLDYGMMGNLMPKERQQLGDVLIYIYTKNIRKLSYTIQQLTFNPQLKDPRGFERDLFEMIEEYDGVSFGEFRLSEIIQRFRVILFTHNIPLPPNFYLLLRSMVIIEGVGFQLNPDFDITKNLQPYAQELIIRKYNPVRIMKEMLWSLESFSVMASGFPQDFREIVKKIKKGKLHIEFEHHGLQPLYKTLDTVSNRVSYAIVVAALIMGSALIVLAGIPPFVFNIPVIGLIGFIISGLMALWLIISIIRHGKI